MRILVLGNNWVGWQVVKWLTEQDEQIVGLVIHPPEKRKYGDEIMSSAQVDPSFVFDGSQLHEHETLEAIRALKPHIGLSVLFDYILQPEFLSLFPSGVVNIHPAYLPYNRGQYPNVWSIIEGTPAGATLHYIDTGVDTGDIIARVQVPVEPIDTGETLYRKLEQTCVDLLEENWSAISSSKIRVISQSPNEGTYHRTEDARNIDRIDLDRRYTARELINIIRARTFPPYPGAYFVHEGRKVCLQLKLKYDGECASGKE